MTTKTISTYIAAGYTLSSAIYTLDITPTGGVGGKGVTAHATAVVDNYGKINASNGYAAVTLLGKGLAYNAAGASITGYRGVEGYGANDVVFNYGVIKVTGNKAVVLNKGGQVLNGGPFNLTSSIDGGIYLLGAGSTIDNYGVIKNGTISISGGGTITNGAPSDSAASMDGRGIEITGGAGTIDNYGLINGNGREGVTLAAAGVVVNGAATDTTARILGGTGVAIVGAGVVTNFGTIRGVVQSDYGVALGDGGVLTNGTVLDETALVEGYSGVRIGIAAGTVVNQGVIEGDDPTRFGLYSQAGGSVTNGGGDDHAALIEGGSGVVLGAAGTVHNFGTIRGATGYGVHMVAGGVLTNGSPTNGAALIEGYQGLVVAAAGSVTNLGTILGTGDGGGAAVSLGVGVSLVNGDTHHAGALIQGYYGLEASGASDTVTNFGAVIGEAGVAVSLHNATDMLTVQAGCVFVGAIYGGGGTLNLASGVGTLTGLFSTGGNVTVSGSMAKTTFQGFHTLEVGTGASFTVAGNGALAAGQSLIVDGALGEAGTLTSAGSLTTGGTLAGAGTLALTGGKAAFVGGANLALAKVTESGATTTASFATANLTYAGLWSQSTGTLTVATGDRVNFSGKADSFSGTLAGAGTIAFTGGSDLLDAAILSATSVIINGASVTLQGAITLSHTLTAATANLVIAAAGATLSGGGTLVLTNAATNAVYGATAAARLTNNDRITGAGLLGDGKLTLVNAAAGSIVGNDSLALTINTGAATIANAGTIEAVGAGGVTISSAVDNTGVLETIGGNLTALGAVTGAGTVKISGGTADFAAAFTENVAFTGTTGVLELSHAQTYTGQVTGFSKTGTTSLDLLDIAFGAKTTASFAGTTASGLLTVTDGTHTAKITLEGDYLTSTFAVSGDGHGGTKVVDPAQPSALHPAPAPMPFISAAASFGAPKGDWLQVSQDLWRSSQPALATPRP